MQSDIIPLNKTLNDTVDLSPYKKLGVDVDLIEIDGYYFVIVYKFQKPFMADINLIWKLACLFSIVLLNLLIIVVFARMLTKKVKLYSNYLFLSMSLSDLLVGLFCISFEIMDTHHIGTHFIDHFLDLPSKIIRMSQKSVTLQTLILLTIHRLKQLVAPKFNSEKLTKFRLSLIISIWLLAYLFSIIFNSIYSISIDNLPYQEISKFIIVTQTFLQAVITPILVVATIIVLCLRHRRSKMNKNVSESFLRSVDNLRSREVDNGNLNRQLSRRMRQSKELKAIYCLLAILFTMILTQLLYTIMSPIVVYSEPNQLTQTVALLDEIGLWLGYMNSLLNPFILIAFHDRVKHELKSMFCASK